MITVGQLLLERIKQTVLNKKSSLWSSPRKVCSYIFPLDLYKITFLQYTMISLSRFPDPFLCNGVLLFYIPSPSFISALHMQARLLIFLILVPLAPSEVFGGSCKAKSYYLGITSTLMWSGGQRQSIQCGSRNFLLRYFPTLFCLILL